MTEASAALREPWPDLRRQRQGVEVGIWVFIATEVLFFSALFLGYTVYRSFNGEAFRRAAAETEIFYGTVNLVLLLAHRSINQREAVRNAARYRVESDRAGLHELGLECRLQQNDFAVLATKLDHGRQPIESEEVEALR